MEDERITKNGNVFATNFCELGVSVKFVNGIDSPLGDTYLFNMDFISQYNKTYLKSLVEKIAVFHHLDLELIDTKEAHFGLFMRKPQQVLSLNNCLYEVGQRDVVIGKDNYGKSVILDFDKIPHLLIGGTTGSGKSVLLHNLLVNLMSYFRTTNEANRFRHGLKLVIIDPKGTELNMYRNVKNTTFIDNTPQAIEGIKAIERAMDLCYQTGGKYDNETFVIIDELADLMLTSKFEVEQSLVRIAQLGRAVGVHLIVATQRPSVDVVSGLIKANMPYRIALRTASVRDSVILIDKKGCEALAVGEALFKNGIETTKVKIAYPEKELEAKFIDVNRG